MNNKQTFLIAGIIIALLIILTPFISVFITSGYWVTHNAFEIEGAARLITFNGSFIIGLLVFLLTLYLYYKE